MAIAPELKAAWGRNIRSAREAAGLTQAQLGAAVGVDETTVFRWETGRMAPSDEHKAAIAAACTLDDARALFPLTVAAAASCTSLSARWCPVHGACRCGQAKDDQRSDGSPLALDDLLCPLHAPSGPHKTDHPRP